VSLAGALPGGLGEPRTVTPLGGGSICEVWRVTLADGRAAVVKRAPYDVAVEVDGLTALAGAGAPVPGVLAADGRTLVLEHVAGPADWPLLGRRLADLHRCTGARFGWERDNLIGSLEQRNTPAQHWPTFYVEQRLRPHLHAPALPAPVRARLERACAGPLLDLLDSDPPASLVHGDLWSGNVVAGRWLIDPAVCRADREHELAYAMLFGGFPAPLLDAYERSWPLPAGWERRRPALQLYHLLVHVRLFGAGYVAAVVSRLDALGW
jgi:fructosamine-3-kinase